MTSNPMSRSERLIHQFFRHVDASSLAFFRVSFGVIMFVEVLRHWVNNWISDYFEPAFLFKYYGFEWVHPLSINGMYWLFGLLAFFSVLIAAAENEKPAGSQQTTSQIDFWIDGISSIIHSRDAKEDMLTINSLQKNNP